MKANFQTKKLPSKDLPRPKGPGRPESPKVEREISVCPTFYLFVQIKVSVNRFVELHKPLGKWCLRFGYEWLWAVVLWWWASSFSDLLTNYFEKSKNGQCQEAETKYLANKRSQMIFREANCQTDLVSLHLPRRKRGTCIFQGVEIIITTCKKKREEEDSVAVSLSHWSDVFCSPRKEELKAPSHEAHCFNWLASQSIIHRQWRLRIREHSTE